MSSEKKPTNVGVSNPYALAEVVLKRKVAWNNVKDPKKLLESTLGTPYEKLFDMKYDSPLYSGLKYNSKTMSVERVEVKPQVGSVRAALVNVGGPAAVWVDIGHFFEEFAELTDPIQGAVGDCYLIAALASVAWTLPFVIAQRTRQTKTGEFVDMIEYFEAGTKKSITATEKIPVIPPGNTPIYARSSDPGEIWPAMYEKVYAKWRNNDAGDTPDILGIAGGDPVGAMSWLTGLTAYYYWTSDLSADSIWSTVKANCNMTKLTKTIPGRPPRIVAFGSSGMPKNPMVAWTYASGQDSPDHVNYSNANIAANHAYSICGLMSYLVFSPHPLLSKSYVVLRNPWGSYESNLGPGGVWSVLEGGYWREFDLPTNDGIFALPVGEFKKYFAGFGVVK